MVLRTHFDDSDFCYRRAPSTKGIRLQVALISPRELSHILECFSSIDMTRDCNFSSSICERSSSSSEFLGLPPAGVGASSESLLCSSRSSWIVAKIPGSLCELADAGTGKGSSHDGSDNSLRSCPRAGRVAIFNSSPHCSASLRSRVMIATGSRTS